MTMRRSWIILFGVLALAGAVFAGSFVVSRHFCRAEAARSTDDLDWLRREFHLSDAAMARVRELHEGYLPKCAAMCTRIAAKKAELETELHGAATITPAAEQTLVELGELRARCQAQMLGHFVEVSRAMPPAEGRRYLAEMQRLTLGLDDSMEQSMPAHAGHEHHEP